MITTKETSLATMCGNSYRGEAKGETADGTETRMKASMTIGDTLTIETEEDGNKPKKGEYIICSRFMGQKIGGPEFEMFGLRRESRKSEKAECFLKKQEERLCFVVIGKEKTEYEIEMEKE